MKTYHGKRLPDGRCRVTVIQPNEPETTLPPRNNLWNHSPDGFEWGYGGSGPAQLALAILADLFDDDRAVNLHQEFKWRRIAGLPRLPEWWMTEADVRIVVADIQQERTKWVRTK